MRVTVCSFYKHNQKTTIQAQAEEDKLFGLCAKITSRQLRNAAKRLGVSRLCSVVADDGTIFWRDDRGFHCDSENDENTTGVNLITVGGNSSY